MNKIFFCFLQWKKVAEKLPKTHPKSCENRLKISKVTKDRKTIENHRILLDNNYTYAALV